MIGVWVVLSLIFGGVTVWCVYPLFTRPTIKAWRYMLGMLSLCAFAYMIMLTVLETR